MEKLSSKERALATLRGEIPDRVPFWLLIAAQRFAGPGYTPAPWDKYIKDSELIKSGIIGAAEACGLDLAGGGSGPASSSYGVLVWGEPWGTEVTIRDPSRVPQPSKYGITTPEEFATVKKMTVDDWFNPEKGKGVTVELKGLEMAIKERPDLCIVGGVPSPYNWATYVASIEDTLGWIITNPEEMLEGCKTLMESGIELAKALREIDCTVVLVTATRDTAEVVNVEMFREFFYPLERQLYENFPKDMVFIAHACGKEPYLEEKVRQYPLDKYAGVNWQDTLHERGNELSLEWAKKTFGDKVTLVTGLSQTETLPFGSPTDVEEEAKYAIMTAAPGGRFILCTGCQTPGDATPMKNIKAIRKAIDKWGTYPITVEQ